MDHDSIRHKLSAYLDGAVTPAEQLLIEKHLEECRDCRNSLAELEKTVLHIRNLGEVAPPPWLAAKIMARVREEAGREKGLLRRLLQLPLRWRVSVEAAALVFLSVTGYFVYKNVSSEMEQIVPLSGVTREESAPSAPLPAASRKVPEERVPVVKKPSEAIKEKQGAGPAPLSQPAEEPISDLSRKKSEPPLPSPAGAPSLAEDKGINNYRVQERGAAKSAAPSAEFSLSDKESRALAGMQRDKTLSSTDVEVLRLELLVADADVAQREIERATARYGGVILRRDVHSEGQTGLVVRLQRKAIKGYIEQLKKVGNVQGQVSAAREGDDTVEIHLAVTTGRD